MSSGEQQLLADLKETFQEFKCTLHDLRTPTEEFVINFYSYFLQEFEVDINNINQSQFSQAAVVNAYHDTYSAAIPKINMLKSIRAFNIVKDFGILDIVSPAPRRTQEILRAFINFYNWSDQRVSNVRDKKVKLFERQDMMIEMRKLREQLRENLNSITKNIPQIRDAKSQLEEEIVVLQENLTDLRLVKKTYKERSDELDAKHKENKAILEKLFKEDLVINSKITDLSKQIVDSPSAVLSELEILRQKHDEISQLRDQKRDLVETKMEAKELLERMLEDQQERVLMLNDLLKLIDQLRELMQAASTSEKNTNASQEHLTELKASLMSKSNRKQNCQEKLQALYLKWKTLKPQLTENVEYILKELKEKKNEKNKMISSLKEDAAVREKIDFTMQQIKITTENAINDYNTLKMQENLLHEQLKKMLESNMASLVEQAEKKYGEK